jgi:hypothetical protein
MNNILHSVNFIKSNASEGSKSKTLRTRRDTLVGYRTEQELFHAEKYVDFMEKSICLLIK